MSGPIPIPGVFRNIEQKCSEKNWCVGMERALEPIANSHKKGFTTLVVMNFETGKERLIGVAYRKAPNDKGAMLNNCPFCGERILWEKENLEAEAAAEPKSELAMIAEQKRDPNYETMSPRDQWDDDKRNGLLDWDGR